ncbi:MAG TPA: hypothetical protein VD811_01785 [Desulfuromonadales bacterium]|nr:hypothetical protein [Desulfuromonadales bacterium]
MNSFGKTAAGFCLALVLLAGVALASEKGHEGHSEAAMTMHHMHMMLNHAVEMAAEGSELVMLGQMNMAKGVDEISIKHGQMMIEDAEKMVRDTLGGKAMKDLHQHGHGPEASADMAYTHELGKAALEYIELLKKMSSAPAHH